MNSTLVKNIQQADGRYLTDEELNPLESYATTYETRWKSYLLLIQKADQLILAVLKEIAQSDPQVIQQHGAKCRQDMGDVLRLISRAILKNDEHDFNEFLLWMQNIMMSLKKETQSARAYQLLQAVAKRELPPESFALMNPYLIKVIEALTLSK